MSDPIATEVPTSDEHDRSCDFYASFGAMDCTCPAPRADGGAEPRDLLGALEESFAKAKADRVPASSGGEGAPTKGAKLRASVGGYSPREPVRVDNLRPPSDEPGPGAPGDDGIAVPLARFTEEECAEVQACLDSGDHERIIEIASDADARAFMETTKDVDWRKFEADHLPAAPSPVPEEGPPPTHAQCRYCELTIVWHPPYGWQHVGGVERCMLFADPDMAPATPEQGEGPGRTCAECGGSGDAHPVAPYDCCPSCGGSGRAS